MDWKQFSLQLYSDELQMRRGNIIFWFKNVQDENTKNCGSMPLCSKLLKCLTRNSNRRGRVRVYGDHLPRFTTTGAEGAFFRLFDSIQLIKEVVLESVIWIYSKRKMPDLEYAEEVV